MGKRLSIGSIRKSQHSGFSLLEVVACLTVLALILVPTTGFMQDVLQGESVQQARGELIHLAHGKQNEFCHVVRTRFRDQSQTGTFANQGHPDLRYSVASSQSPALGGVPGRLMAVQTIAWQDADGNQRLDASEAACQLWTCVARATP